MTARLTLPLGFTLSILTLLGVFPASAFGQATERIGPRAPGMGGAFVAVADDSSAGWWNPAGLAAGAFFDLSLAAGTDVTGFSAGIPPFGASYYRFPAPADPTGAGEAGREDRRARAPLRASQAGITLVHTLVDGVHAGATLRVTRGDVLDAAGGWDGTATTGDLDLGVIAVTGALRFGAVLRNARAPRVGDVRLDRMLRVGVAFDTSRLASAQAGAGGAMVAVDADLREYAADAGPRQVIAAGVERWFGARRLALRTGARVNVAPGGQAAATAGGSVALRAGLFVDGHAALGGAAERGWGVAGRVSF